MACVSTAPKPALKVPIHCPLGLLGAQPGARHTGPGVGFSSWVETVECGAVAAHEELSVLARIAYSMLREKSPSCAKTGACENEAATAVIKRAMTAMCVASTAILVIVSPARGGQTVEA